MRRKSKSKTQANAAERWTPGLAKKGYTQVVTPFLALYPLLSITPTEALLLINLVSYRWKNEAPYPSNRTLATRLGLQNSRNVRIMTSRLEKKGLLKRVERSRKDGSKTSNSYELEPLFHRLEHLMETEDGKRPLGTAEPDEAERE